MSVKRLTKDVWFGEVESLMFTNVGDHMVGVKHAPIKVICGQDSDEICVRKTSLAIYRLFYFHLLRTDVSIFYSCTWCRFPASLLHKSIVSTFPTP
jgi:hypothetical protein